jgi:hypothetical protein
MQEWKVLNWFKVLSYAVGIWIMQIVWEHVMLKLFMFYEENMF